MNKRHTGCDSSFVVANGHDIESCKPVFTIHPVFTNVGRGESGRAEAVDI